MGECSSISSITGFSREESTSDPSEENVMATLYEYFISAGSNTLRVKNTRQFQDKKKTLGQVTSQVHFDFEARAYYVSFYIEEMSEVSCPEAIILNNLESIIRDLTAEVQISAGFIGEDTNVEDLVFTGQIYFYSERPVTDDIRSNLVQDGREKGQRLTFRSTRYVSERNRWEKPQAFICHDARDKEEIAQPLALALQKKMCTVWFDEFTLKVGDSLRREIERGLKECSKCIIIISQYFLNNGGWARREYDSAFTREVLNERSVILPVWHGVSAKDVYDYSPALADKVGIDWALGEDEVARQLIQAIGD